eukprot:Rmarinus@m.5865
MDSLLLEAPENATLRRRCAIESPSDGLPNQVGEDTFSFNGGRPEVAPTGYAKAFECASTVDQSGNEPAVCVSSAAAIRYLEESSHTEAETNLRSDEAESKGTVPNKRPLLCYIRSSRPRSNGDRKRRPIARKCLVEGANLRKNVANSPDLGSLTNRQTEQDLSIATSNGVKAVNPASVESTLTAKSVGQNGSPSEDMHCVSKRSTIKVIVTSPPSNSFLRCSGQKKSPPISNTDTPVITALGTHERSIASSPNQTSVPQLCVSPSPCSPPTRTHVVAPTDSHPVAPSLPDAPKQTEGQLERSRSMSADILSAARSCENGQRSFSPQSVRNRTRAGTMQLSPSAAHGYPKPSLHSPRSLHSPGALPIPENDVLSLPPSSPPRFGSRRALRTNSTMLSVSGDGGSFLKQFQDQEALSPSGRSVSAAKRILRRIRSRETDQFEAGEREFERRRLSLSGTRSTSTLDDRKQSRSRSVDMGDPHAALSALAAVELPSNIIDTSSSRQAIIEKLKKFKVRVPNFHRPSNRQRSRSLHTLAPHTLPFCDGSEAGNSREASGGLAGALRRVSSASARRDASRRGSDPAIAPTPAISDASVLSAIQQSDAPFFQAMMPSSPSPSAHSHEPLPSEPRKTRALLNRSSRKGLRAKSATSLHAAPPRTVLRHATMAVGQNASTIALMRGGLLGCVLQSSQKQATPHGSFQEWAWSTPASTTLRIPTAAVTAPREVLTRPWSILFQRIGVVWEPCPGTGKHPDDEINLSFDQDQTVSKPAKFSSSFSKKDLHAIGLEFVALCDRLFMSKKRGTMFGVFRSLLCPEEVVEPTIVLKTKLEQLLGDDKTKSKVEKGIGDWLPNLSMTQFLPRDDSDDQNGRRGMSRPWAKLRAVLAFTSATKLSRGDSVLQDLVTKTNPQKKLDTHPPQKRDIKNDPQELMSDANASTRDGRATESGVDGNQESEHTMNPLPEPQPSYVPAHLPEKDKKPVPSSGCAAVDPATVGSGDVAPGSFGSRSPAQGTSSAPSTSGPSLDNTASPAIPDCSENVQDSDSTFFDDDDLTDSGTTDSELVSRDDSEVLADVTIIQCLPSSDYQEDQSAVYPMNDDYCSETPTGIRPSQNATGIGETENDYESIGNVRPVLSLGESSESIDSAPFRDTGSALVTPNRDWTGDDAIALSNCTGAKQEAFGSGVDSGDAIDYKTGNVDRQEKDRIPKRSPPVSCPNGSSRQPHHARSGGSDLRGPSLKARSSRSLLPPRPSILGGLDPCAGVEALKSTLSSLREGRHPPVKGGTLEELVNLGLLTRTLDRRYLRLLLTAYITVCPPLQLANQLFASFLSAMMIHKGFRDERRSSVESSCSLLDSARTDPDPYSVVLARNLPLPPRDIMHRVCMILSLWLEWHSCHFDANLAKRIVVFALHVVRISPIGYEFNNYGQLWYEGILESAYTALHVVSVRKKKDVLCILDSQFKPPGTRMWVRRGGIAIDREDAKLMTQVLEAPLPRVPSHKSLSAPDAKLQHIPARELARQLTLYEFTLFRRIVPTEFLVMSWADERKQFGPNICTCIQHFNFISSLLATIVLFEGTSNTHIPSHPDSNADTLTAPTVLPREHSSPPSHSTRVEPSSLPRSHPRLTTLDARQKVNNVRLGSSSRAHVACDSDANQRASLPEPKQVSTVEKVKAFSRQHTARSMRRVWWARRKQGVKQAAKAIAYLVKLAVEFRKLRNYSGILEVVAALNNAAIHRLTPVWERFKNKHPKRFQQYHDLQELTRSENNFSNLRQAISESSNDDSGTPYMPYLGMFLTDLTFIEDGNPAKLGGLINWEKLRLVSETLLSIQSVQNLSYAIQPCSYVIGFVRSSEVWSSERMYAESIRIKPRE